MAYFTGNDTLLKYDLLDGHSELTNFSTTRRGGCGVGSYATMNCSPHTGDNPGRVKRNQEMLKEILVMGDSEHLVIPYQTHSVGIATIDESYLHRQAMDNELYLHNIDALITDLPGYCLCVSTADCVPILLYDPKNKAIAAVHAGWRGTIERIAVETIATMQVKYGSRPEDILACIGPSISLDSYEVGDEVWQAFSREGFNMKTISKRSHGTGKWHIDLWEANNQQLLALGVQRSKIEIAGICTYIHHDKFFSARRLGINSGRILSGIMLK